jgi:hypothetical protein
MDVMIGAIRPQLPKHTTGVITFAKTRLIPPLEMKEKTSKRTKGASEHLKEPNLKNIPNM